MRTLYESVPRGSFDVVVALGGGSVLDTAKVLATETGQGFSGVETLVRNNAAPVAYRSLPIIALPTTAGTGSEVTPWGTVWDTHARRKLSLHLPTLWAEHALCDPELAYTLSPQITMNTALDALSHAMESLWSTRTNGVSSALAARAIAGILAALPRVLAAPLCRESRSELLQSALLAGLAFSNTQTALAHATSYYLTLYKGVSHGLACSFSLPTILEHVVRADPARRACFTTIFGADPVNTLRAWFESLGVPTRLGAFGVGAAELLVLQRDALSYAQARCLCVPAEPVLEDLVRV